MHGSDKDRRVENITEIEGRGELRAQGIFLSIRVDTATGTDFCDTDEGGDRLTINMLSDDVLLEIFDSCRKGHTVNGFYDTPVWRWYELVHVCQKWRQIVFDSPQRLDLQILCTYGSPVRENLGCWPSFPLAIHYVYYNKFTSDNEDSLFAALEHPVAYVALILT